MRARRTARNAAIATAVVVGGVAGNQILNDGEFAWPWIAPAFGAALLGVLGTGASAPGGDTALRGRLSRYRRQLHASVSDMETLGLVTRGEFVLRMKHVYVDVALRPRPARETSGDPGVGVRADPGERRPLADFLDGGRVLAVIGSPGSGKTTLVRHTALALSEPPGPPWRRAFRRARRVPVLLYLRGHTAAILSGDARGLPEVAVAAPWLRGAVEADWLAGHLEAGRCVVLLDGLDEVADEADRRRVVAWVRDQIARYPGNAFVVTSRRHGYESNPLPNADVLQVQRFTADQVAEFLHGWYRAVERRAREGSDADVREAADAQAADLVARLRAKPSLYDLAANPLLLTMIANVHRYRGSLPGTRAALYAEMCEVLLHRRQESKSLSDPTGLSGSQKEAVAGHLAFQMTERGVRDLSEADAVRAVEEPLREAVGDRPGLALLFLAEATRCGLLVEHEQGCYAFAHLTLQEYLTAAHIREHPDLLPLLLDGVHDPWLRETTLLWASRADATPVVRACLDRGTVPALTLAFACADEARQLHPATRAALNALLTEETGPNPDRRRLINAITAARALQDVIRLHNGTEICAHPVSQDLWTRYLREAIPTGHHPEPVAPGPATGIPASEILPFLAWLNRLSEATTVYLPPSPAILSGPDAATLPAASGHTLWTLTDDIPRLHRTLGATWPYTPSPQRLAAYPDLAMDWLDPYLKLDARGTGLRRPHLTAYARIFALAPYGSATLQFVFALEAAALTTAEDECAADPLVAEIMRPVFTRRAGELHRLLGPRSVVETDRRLNALLVVLDRATDFGMIDVLPEDLTPPVPDRRLHRAWLMSPATRLPDSANDWTVSLSRVLDRLRDFPGIAHPPSREPPAQQAAMMRNARTRLTQETAQRYLIAERQKTTNALKRFADTCVALDDARAFPSAFGAPVIPFLAEVEHSCEYLGLTRQGIADPDRSYGLKTAWNEPYDVPTPPEDPLRAFDAIVEGVPEGRGRRLAVAARTIVAGQLTRTEPQDARLYFAAVFLLVAVRAMPYCRAQAANVSALIHTLVALTPSVRLPPPPEANSLLYLTRA
ncbi:NACHT domain-containing protein [Actinocorallia sp. A-T 12471]|uniref:NACHT domain-containing protein n=1 Tax=Actinocorallia sp. A-T 12471 TaxID=3089813 RepID=UPI0029D1F10C|nr:NACHT domain-containing protein [Actinocorallia sp. A-T 12471]MDX6744485.1 NACHT domain-containing protein [Actinocorallia sp. A-T 12471]